MLSLIAVNTKGNEAENIGMARLTSYVNKKFNLDVELIYLYDYDDHVDNLHKIKNTTQIIGVDIYHDTVDYVYKLIHDLKQKFPNAYFFTGGKYALMTYKEIIRDCSDIDFVILGDGEYALEYLINKLISDDCNISRFNIAHKNDMLNKSPQFIDINKLPFPVRDKNLLDLQQRAYIYSSTGCSGTCSFCRSNISEKWYMRSATSIIDEIELIYKKYGTKSFFFTDDNFAEFFEDNERKRIDDFCNYFISNNKKYAFGAQIRANSFEEKDRDLLLRMKRAGFYTLFVGVEAANKKDLKIYNKNININTNSEILNLLESVGMDSSFFGFILLGPYSTLETISQNTTFLNERKVWDITKYISKLSVYYTSPIYYKLKKDNLLKSEYSYKSDHDYRFYCNEIEEIDNIVSKFKNSNFISKLFEFFNYNMYYNAMTIIYNIDDDNIHDNMINTKNNLAEVNAKFFTELYLNGNYDFVKRNIDSFQNYVASEINKAMKFKFKLIKNIIIQNNKKNYITANNM